MKARIPRTVLISETRSRASAGGVTLETALIMPMFLMLVVFLIFMIQTSVISMALHGAVSQTVRQAASAWYPVSLSLEQARSSELNKQAEELHGKWLPVKEMLTEYGHMFPSPMKEWAEQASQGSFSLEQQAAEIAFGELARQFVDHNVLDDSRLHLAAVDLPSKDDREKAYLTLQAEYILPFQVPFLGRKLVIRESARERVWIGGSPSQSKLQGKSDQALDITFVSLEPNPVRPGRKATLVLRTTPGTRVDLSILYKSGISQAKHLGSAVSDSSGLVSWTWHVSGRTTPGQWNWQVSSPEGGMWQQSFEVAGRSAAAMGEVDE
ncbi:TadE family protein [Cohnella kolymensis]|uniref:TadE family protein n=1 Tax=Cohnella kolymensis TaxID=1590652 RepID=UPI000695E190|nr:TadE family protein [Cohnella kolymensis]